MDILDLQKEILRGLQSGIAEAVHGTVTTYNSSIKGLVEAVISNHAEEIKALLESSISQAISNEDFKGAINSAFTHKLARALIDKLEGSIDRRVNELKNDPMMKAKMLLAIEGVITR